MVHVLVENVIKDGPRRSFTIDVAIVWEEIGYQVSMEEVGEEEVGGDEEQRGNETKDEELTSHALVMMVVIVFVVLFGCFHTLFCDLC